MHLYKKLATLRYFTHSDMVRLIGSESAAQWQIKKYLKEILLPEGDMSFWTAFAKGEYKPEVLFDVEELLSRIEQHPMAMWKCSMENQD